MSEQCNEWRSSSRDSQVKRVSARDKALALDLFSSNTASQFSLNRSGATARVVTRVFLQ